MPDNPSALSPVRADPRQVGQMRRGDQLKATSSYGRSSSCPAIAMLRNVCCALLALSIGDAPLPADRLSITSLSGTSQPFVNTDRLFQFAARAAKEGSRALLPDCSFSAASLKRWASWAKRCSRVNVCFTRNLFIKNPPLCKSLRLGTLPSNLKCMVKKLLLLFQVPTIFYRIVN